MYTYTDERKAVFTEEGTAMLMKIRSAVDAAITAAGAVRFDKATSRIGGNSWTMLACFDYLVETGYLIELSYPDGCWGQDRVFTRPPGH